MTRLLRNVALGLLALIVLAVAAVSAALVVSAPERPAEGSESALRLEPGPRTIESRELVLVDASRETAANGDQPGLPSRRLPIRLWYPIGDDAAHPLVVYSHGFMSTKEEGGYLAEHLASHGYIVVAADYPLTNFGTPGGPNVADAANQPADVSFLIDSILALKGAEKPFAGTIDPERIGAMGLSLGGLTTTLVAFHPTLRDPRLRAAVSIAGPASFFSERFFSTTDVPFLMIAGTEDAMVDYQANARPVLTRVRSGGLLSIEAGSHTGFAGIADPLFRFVDHPDSIGCGALMENIEIRDGEFPITGLGGEENGIVVTDQSLPCQKSRLPKAIHPGRQHMITTLAATDFFRSVFAREKDEREAAARHLSTGIAADFPEASYEASRL